MSLPDRWGSRNGVLLMGGVDVLRRYKRSWVNFLEVYRLLADHWTVYDTSEAIPRLLERGP
jgi:predicted ABC-type ATPase